MPEDKPETKPQPKNDVGKEEKPQPPAQTAKPVQPTPQAQKPPAAPPPQAKPPPAQVVPRPVPAQPAKPQLLGTPKKGRRRFLKALVTAGGILALTPYLPMGSFLLPIGGQVSTDRQKIVLSDGTTPNVKTFPVNSKAVFVYPRTGDEALDSEPFRRYQLIRLPPEFGGDANNASALRAYSMICVHLWCLWDYKPQRKRVECPCHGSIYDACSGKAIAGPASLQTPPNNALPQLRLAVEDDGSISVIRPDRSAAADGIIGFGRRVETKGCSDRV